MKNKNKHRKRTITKAIDEFWIRIKGGFSIPERVQNKKSQQAKSQPNGFYLLTVFSNNNKIFVLRADRKNSRLELFDLGKKSALFQLSLEGENKIRGAWKWQNVRISKINDVFVLTCKIVSERKVRIGCWTSKDLLHWFKSETKEKLKGPLSVVHNYKHDHNKIAYFGGDKKVLYCQINNMSIVGEFKETDLRVVSGHFDEKNISPANVFLTKNGILLFYYAYNKKGEFGIGLVLINKSNPSQILWRTDSPIYQSNISKKEYYPLGIVRKGKRYEFYCKDKNENLYIVYLPLILRGDEFFRSEDPKYSKERQKAQLSLKRDKKNPILTPQPENHWEANGSFNPAAVYLDEKVHLIYRAIGRDGVSVFGHAVSKDGTQITERVAEPIYLPSEPFEFVKKSKQSFCYPYMSGGGWGGCEDPRISVVGDDIFMTYTAFNGHQAPGVALTSIKVNDFLNKKWNWKKPRLISEPHKIQKNWVVFPEKINGKYAILHSISPDVLIDYFDSLDRDDIIIKSQYSGKSNGLKWENVIRGVGAPPIKTKQGWLVFYHAMDSQHPDRYKLGVMLLDYKNPQKILSRHYQPILEPDEVYENDGKPGVIYVCGAIVRKGKLFVYYGGADKVTCVATASLKKILDSLMNPTQKNSLKKLSFFSQ